MIVAESKNGMQMRVIDDKTAAFYASSSCESVLAASKSPSGGLAPSEIRQRIIEYGANELPKSARRRWYVQLASNFVHLFALLLWVGAFLAWLAGMPQLCWAIVVVILINGTFSYWQEYQAERAAEALQALLPRLAGHVGSCVFTVWILNCFMVSRLAFRFAA